ncbi:MAG: hypothetical protein ACLP1D_07320 [Xanthobacteraceae bacterium]|jgi:hypothetical protein
MEKIYSIRNRVCLIWRNRRRNTPPRDAGQDRNSIRARRRLLTLPFPDYLTRERIVEPLRHQLRAALKLANMALVRPTRPTAEDRC